MGTVGRGHRRNAPVTASTQAARFTKSRSQCPRYALTPLQARRCVSCICVRTTAIYYEKHGEKPHLPYRTTFKRAIAGDFASRLHTIFSDSQLSQWRITKTGLTPIGLFCYAVGDVAVFAAFLSRLPPTARDDIFMYSPTPHYGA